jgi:hypothetical protein
MGSGFSKGNSVFFQADKPVRRRAHNKRTDLYSNCACPKLPCPARQPFRALSPHRRPCSPTVTPVHLPPAACSGAYPACKQGVFVVQHCRCIKMAILCKAWSASTS